MKIDKVVIIIFCFCCFFRIAFTKPNPNRKDNSKHQSIVDSLRKREATLPTIPDPVSYLDDATAGTFKPNTPPKGLEEPLDPSRRLERGFRIRVAQTDDERQAKRFFNQILSSSRYPPSIQYKDEIYNLLVGNFLDSLEAAKQLDNPELTRYGTLKVVQSQVFLQGSSLVQPFIEENSSGYTIQVATFSNKSSAVRLKEQLTTKFNLPVRIQESKSNQWIVLIGQFQSKEDAKRTQTMLKNKGYKDSWIRQ